MLSSELVGWAWLVVATGADSTVGLAGAAVDGAKHTSQPRCLCPAPRHNGSHGRHRERVTSKKKPPRHEVELDGGVV